MAEPDLKAIEADVLDGLTGQQSRLNDAALAQAFYDYNGKRFMQVFLRDAETPFDYIGRPYRMGGLTRMICGVLTDHLYSPGPSRTWDIAAGQVLLEQVYRDNHLDSMMLRADQLSTLNDVAAIQVDADEGDFAGRPITLRLWGAQDFHCWTDPRNRTIPRVCCTIDRFADRTDYNLWTDEEVRTYREPRGESGVAAGKPELVGAEPHEYGCLPFSFIHYEQPITSFWEVGIGAFLAQAEIRINDRLSRLDESINKHHNPLPIAKDVPDDFQLIVEAQRFVKLSRKPRLDGSGGFSGDTIDPELSYLQADIDVDGSWMDLTNYVNLVLEAARVPASAVRMEQTGIASGISLIVEQAPLLTRARSRRRPFSVYETDLARTVLRCAGNHYRKAALMAAAMDGKLSLAWPQPTVPVPTMDNLDLLTSQVRAGLKSIPMAVQEWYGVSRDEAFELLEQIEEDNAELRDRVPELHARLNPEPDEDDGGGDSGDAPPGREPAAAANGQAKGNGELTADE